MKKLLPQANSLSTVVDVFIYVSKMTGWNLNDVAEFCKFEPRQSSYYINACYYLGLLEEDGTLSEFGKTIVEHPASIKTKIYERVISDSVISKVFANLMINGERNLKKDTIKLLKGEYPEYSDAVIDRRSSTIINWCNEVKAYILRKNIKK